MNIKNSFNGFIKRTLSGIRRFPLSAFFGFAVFVSAAFFLFAPEPEGGAEKAASALSDLALQASFASALAFFTCMIASLAAMRFSLAKKVHIPLYAFSTALWGLGFFLAKRMDEFNYASLAYWGIICICILAGLYFCVTASNEKTVFLHILKSVVFAEWVACIASVGLWLSLWAVNELIIPIEHIEEYISLIAVFSQAVIAANVFLSQLSFEKDFPPARMYKALVLYAAFPVYVIYVVVLYVYLVKILVTRNMPGGQINIFVSLATAFYLFFYCTLKAFPCRATALFYKIGAFVMLPCIASQLVAVWIRFAAYGLTPLRWAGILYTVSVLFFIGVVVLKKDAVRAWLIFAAFLCALSTLTPFSLTRVSSLQQKARLEKLLHEYGYYALGRFAKPDEASVAQIPHEKRRAIADAYKALLSEHKTAYAGEDARSGDEGFQDIFGFSINEEGAYIYKYKVYTRSRSKPFDIAPYAFLLPVSDSGYRNRDSGWVFTRIPLSVQKTEYDIFDALLALPERGEDFTVTLDDKTTLFITSADYEYNSELKGFVSYQFEGFVCR